MMNSLLAILASFFLDMLFIIKPRLYVYLPPLPLFYQDTNDISESTTSSRPRTAVRNAGRLLFSNTLHQCRRQCIVVRCQGFFQILRRF